MLLTVKSYTSIYIPPEHQHDFQQELNQYNYAMHDGIWDIPNGVVGNISTENLTLQIRPSVEYLTFLDYFNLLLLNLFNSKQRKFDYSDHKHNNLAESILYSFKDELERVVASGLPRKYILKKHRSEFLSGNVDIVKTFLNIRLAEHDPVFTSMEVLSYEYEEIMEISLAYEKFKKITSGKVIGFEKLARYIEPIKFNKSKYLKHKNFESLSLCYNLAYIINNNLGGLAKGERESISFLLKSNQIFEEFVTNYIKSILPTENFTVKDSKDVASTDDGSSTLTISPDLIYSSPVVVILDMKNKNFYKNLESSDYHQMISYMSAYRSKTALLLYPVVEDVEDDVIYNILHDESLKVVRIGVNIRNLNPNKFKEKIISYLYFD